MQDLTAADEKWYFTKEQLASTPSRDCGYDADKEIMCRQQAANFIQDMGQRLQVTQLCINTAIVYMHRFYVFHSFTHFHKHTMAAAALFLAAKVEEQPRKLEHVIKVTQVCLHREQARFDIRSEEYQAQAQDLVFNENVLLQTLGFDVVIDHPHTHVVRCCHLVRASKDLAQTSYFMASNSLHLTTMCLQYKPTVVACFCIHLACKWSNWEIPQSSEGKYWYYYVDKTVTHDLLEQLTTEFLAIFDKAPSRMKRKILQNDKLMQGAAAGGGGAGGSHEGVTFPPQQRPQHPSHLQDPNRSSSSQSSSSHPPQTQRVDLREYQGRERERQDRERHLLMSGTQSRPAEANRDSHYRGHGSGHHASHPPGAARGHHHQDMAKGPPPHHSSSSAARPDRPDRPDRPERMDRPDRQHRPDRPDRPYRPERPQDRPDAAAGQSRHSVVTMARDQARREQAMARDVTKRDTTTGVMFMPPTRHEPVAAASSDSPDPSRTGTRGSGSNLSQDSGIGLNYSGPLESGHSSQDSSDGNRLGFGPSSNSSKEYPGSIPIVPQDARHPVSHDGKPKPGHSSTDPLSATRHRMNVVSSDRKGVSLAGDTSGMKDCKPSMADPKGGVPQPPHNHKHSDKTDHQGRHRRHHENLLNPPPSSREDANSSGSSSTSYDKKVMQEMSNRRNLEAFFEKTEMAKLSEKHQAAAPYASSRQPSAPVIKREPSEEQNAKALPPYHSASSSHRQSNPALAHIKREKSPGRQAGTSRPRPDPTISPQTQPGMQPPVALQPHAAAAANRAISPLAKPSLSQKSVPPHPSAAMPHMKPIKSEPQDTPPMTSRNGTLDEMDARHDPKRIHTEEAAAPITPFANIKVEPKLPEQLGTSYGPPYTTSSQPPVKSIFSPEKSATPHERGSPFAQREKLKTSSSDKGLGSFGSPPGSAKGSKRARTSSSSDSEVPTAAARSEEPVVKAELVDPSDLLSAPLSMPVSVPVSVPVSMPVSVRRDPSDLWASVTAPNGSHAQPSQEAKATAPKSADLADGAFPVKTEPALGSQVANQVGGVNVEPEPFSIKTDPLVPTEAPAGSSQVDEAGHHSHHKSKKKKEKKEKHKHKDKDREKNREEKKHKSKHKEKDKERKKELEASSQSVAPIKISIKKPIEPVAESAASVPPLAPVESSSLKIKIPKERLQHVEPPPRDSPLVTSSGLKLKIKCGEPMAAASATSTHVPSKESRKRDRSSPGDEVASKVPKMVPMEQPKRSSSGANFSRQNGLESRGMGRHQHKVSAGGGSKNPESSRGGSS